MVSWVVLVYCALKKYAHLLKYKSPAKKSEQRLDNQNLFIIMKYVLKTAEQILCMIFIFLDNYNIFKVFHLQNKTTKL